MLDSRVPSAETVIQVSGEAGALCEGCRCPLWPTRRGQVRRGIRIGLSGIANKYLEVNRYNFLSVLHVIFGTSLFKKIIPGLSENQSNQASLFYSATLDETTVDWVSSCRPHIVPCHRLNISLGSLVVTEAVGY